MYIIIVNMDITIVIVSVADPDPVGSVFFWVTRIRENTGSGSGYFIHKRSLYLKFSRYFKLSKLEFRPNNFFFFDFKCQKMFRFGKKMP